MAGAFAALRWLLGARDALRTLRIGMQNFFQHLGITPATAAA